ncbi:MAG: molybdate transport system ATP-binding protein [Acidobacteriaceae bacterium]|jgi:molybdate transport system ATP-binding protein|nr:molybdate transport system ATP-binding protein [Acidobacteriaceae bacterium]
MLKARLRKARSGNTQPSFALDVALEIPPGITIVFGPSGAGKSTLLDCIAGLLKPDNGRIEIAGEVLLDVEQRIDVPPAKRKIAYVFQSLALFPHMTVEQNAAYGLAELPAPQRASRVKAMLEAFHVDQLTKRKGHELSGGEQQRVALARSLATSPRLLLLDEPLTALDEGLKKSIIEDLRKWNAAQNIPILYVTHSRAEVDALGERVIALDQGKIVSTGTPHEVLDAPRRSSIAQASGFENLFSGVVTELREADGVMRVQLVHGACEIETPLGHAAVATAVRLAIRAGDILLATERPYGLSARNVIAGKIISLEQRGTMFVAQVAADSDGAVIFTVHLTLGAKRSLELDVNRPVWLVIKTHSCHVLED